MDEDERRRDDEALLACEMTLDDYFEKYGDEIDAMYDNTDN